MPNFTLLRTWQLENLERNLEVIGYLVRTTDPQAAVTFRDGGTGWTVLEVLCHLRDWDHLWKERAEITLTGVMPDMPMLNPDAVAAERNYMGNTLEGALTMWQQNRAVLLNTLRAIEEDDWERSARHSRRGLMTLHDQLVMATWHDLQHQAQMVNILTQKLLPSGA
ncbi:MAG: DinB family protein [Phototrophicaceae bacterium]|jgi:uncharacterized damage-inducible protein DinB